MIELTREIIEKAIELAKKDQDDLLKKAKEIDDTPNRNRR